jgi:hypothetical protein
MTLSFSGKHVACQKSKNLGADTYLFTTIDGVVESSLVVEALPSATVLQEDAKAIVGTIEMRVYVLRRFGDHHMPQDLPKYHESVWKGTRRKADDPVGYTTIEPDFVLTAEEDLAAIETRLANKYRKAMDGARPGLEPWAIFRFHYRRKRKCESYFEPYHKLSCAQKPYSTRSTNRRFPPHGRKSPKLERCRSSSSIF